MALRDHSLDEKIIAAARDEFLEKGYMGASLRKIAERAGVTVGAIQTRYKSKDELFADVLKPLLADIETAFTEIKSDYYAAFGTDILKGLKMSMKYESEMIFRLIFAHYEQAMLLFYGSAGSALEHYFDVLVQKKIEESIIFFQKAGYGAIDEKLLGMLISVQFVTYKRLIIDCTDKESAEKYMSELMIYHFGGWAALFDTLKKEEINDEV